MRQFYLSIQWEIFILSCHVTNDKTVSLMVIHTIGGKIMDFHWMLNLFYPRVDISCKIHKILLWLYVITIFRKEGFDLLLQVNIQCIGSFNSQISSKFMLWVFMIFIKTIAQMLLMTILRSLIFFLLFICAMLGLLMLLVCWWLQLTFLILCKRIAWLTISWFLSITCREDQFELVSCLWMFLSKICNLFQT